MSITKLGKVTVSEEEVLIEKFVFAGVNMDEAGGEALKWAIERCTEQLAKINPGGE